jgi:hypothetical protein
LPNRELFKDRLSEALKLAKRHGRRVGLLFLDLDNFKPRTLRIVLGSDCRTEDLIDLINEGAVYKFLCKPVSLPQLREILRKAFVTRGRGVEQVTSGGKA